MRIVNVLELNGPNVWGHCPAVEAWVEATSEGGSSVEIAGFSALLLRSIPSLGRQPGLNGGQFGADLEAGVPLVRVFERLAWEIHALSSAQPGRSGVAAEAQPGRYRVWFECETPAFGKACFENALELLTTLASGGDVDVAALVRRLGELADAICLGPGTRAIVRAAQARGIPSVRLSSDNLVQLGYCRHQRRIWTAETDGTGAIAESIAQDKELTRRLLAGVGVPVPVGRAVTSPADAWVAAQELGLPVVVKPRDGNHGRGVSIRLDEQSAIEAAYGFAASEGTGVVVERFIPGTHYRVLVVGSKAIAAAGGDADQVVGDGVSSVDQLVAAANLDPLRGNDHNQPLTTMVLDEISVELLRRQGLTRDAVPAAGRTVLIHYSGDLTLDVTDRMHPEVAHQCALAARTVGLDIAGIDLISETIGLPLEQIGGAIIEVNAGPSLTAHLKPLSGSPRPVGEAIVEQMFGSGPRARVPLLTVTGPRAARTSRAVAALLINAGIPTAVANSEGFWVGNRRLTTRNSANAAGYSRALINPFVDAVVFEVQPDVVLREGIPFDCVDVAVTTRGDATPVAAPVADWAPSNWASSLAADLPGQLVATEGARVRDSQDPAVSSEGREFLGSIVYFGRAPGPGQKETPVQVGRIACEAERDRLWLWMAEQRHTVAHLPDIVPAHDRDFEFTLSDLSAAVAAVAALGVDVARIAAGCEAALAEVGKRS